MASAGTINTHNTPLIHTSPEAQEARSLSNNSITEEPIHVTYREDGHLQQKTVDLEEEVGLWKQALSEKADQHRQTLLEIQHWQRETADVRAKAKNLELQLQQQAAIMSWIKEQHAQAFIRMEREQQRRKLVQEHLENEHHRNTQLVQFVGALHIMKPEDLEKLLDHSIDLDGILANYPTIAAEMGAIEWACELLEKWNGVREQLLSMM